VLRRITRRFEQELRLPLDRYRKICSRFLLTTGLGLGSFVKDRLGLLYRVDCLSAEHSALPRHGPLSDAQCGHAIDGGVQRNGIQRTRGQCPEAGILRAPTRG